jgi:hypothetical protein
MPPGTRRHRPLAALILALTVGCDKPTTPSSSGASAPPPAGAGPNGARAGRDLDRNGERVPFDDAQVFFEFNTTANDMGFQLVLDAEGWKHVTVAGPRNRGVVSLIANGSLAELGITELRFESAEPSPPEVLAQFPPGEYAFRGKTVEGATLASTARLSHHLLAPPRFSPSDDQVVDPGNAVVAWTAPGAARVEVIIEHSALRHAFDVIVPGSTTRLNVPPQVLARGERYKIELLAIAENGNRTIAESTFRTAP